jgi:hypothetical protein
MMPLSTCLLVGCAKAPPLTNADASSPAVDSAPAQAGTVTISTVARTPLPTLGLGTSYWSWSPSYGAPIAGTEPMVLPLTPTVMRIGGYNNDTNSPDPFDDAQLDKAVAYARAIAAEPILQVPLLADVAGATPSPDTAAAMVSYANLTKGYGIKYFSIGNEPDLYPDATGATKGIAGYTPASFCASAQAYVAAMKAVDPTIKILGPELSWKYQSGSNDWLTPILQACGSLFDVVTVHRYPIDPAQTTVDRAAADASAMRGVIAHLRSIMDGAGLGDKPLAITECNITWNGDPATTPLAASPGTVPAGLWAADTFGVSLETGLWASIFWSTREGWTLGLLSPSSGAPTPAYRALALYAAHFGPTMVVVTGAPAGVHAYASRDATDTSTRIVVVNWNDAAIALTFQIDQGGVAPPTYTLPPLSMAAVEIPDGGAPAAWVYGKAQSAANLPPQALP